jgi:glutathione S-transferase
MLTVYSFGPAFGLADPSPYVVKLETWLRMARVPYRNERGDLRKAPKKKIPYVADGNRLISDSSHIIEYLEEKHGDPLNEKRFGKTDRAVAQALKSLFEADLYFIVAYLRWWNDDDFEIMKPVLSATLSASGVPKFAVPAVLMLARRSARGQIDGQGTGRHAREEVYAMGRTLVEAASELLGSKKFFMDDLPSKIDATAYGMLSGIIYTPFDNPVKACALDRPNIVAYCDRIRDMFWTAR